MNLKNPVVWFEIYVDDIERAKRFYEQVLNTELSDLAMPEISDAEEARMFAVPMKMDEEGAAGALVEMNGFKAGGNSTIIYFDSEDCSIEEGRIENAGGSVMQSKQFIGEYGFMVLASDTEGDTFGVHSLV